MAGKLFALKKWLSIADAAKRLSASFGEEVTEADIFRLALDGELRLSCGGAAPPKDAPAAQ